MMLASESVASLCAELNQRRAGDEIDAFNSLFLQSEESRTFPDFRGHMPLYEYQCKKCHHRFEKIQKFSDPHVKKCPRCGGAVEQLLSPPAVQFKGSGWYVTDYAKKSGATSQQSSDGGASDKGEKVEKKEEAKPKSEHKKSEKKH